MLAQGNNRKIPVVTIAQMFIFKWRFICRSRRGCLNSLVSTRLRPADRVYYELNFRYQSIGPQPSVGLRAGKEGEKCRSLDHMKQIHKSSAARGDHELPTAVSEINAIGKIEGLGS